MKTLASVLNVLLVVVASVKLWIPSAIEDYQILFCIYSAPLCSLVAMRSSLGYDWLALFMERKALEERRLIENLRAGHE